VKLLLIPTKIEKYIEKKYKKCTKQGRFVELCIFVCCFYDEKMINWYKFIIPFGGNGMDTFIDKLAQKRNAQEMIRANTSAETAKMEQMRKQLETYEDLLQEMRKVNLKTAENAAEAQNVMKECMAKLEQLEIPGESGDDSAQLLEEIKQLLKEQSDRSDDFLHRENVKVYRNVQAAMVEELNKQTAELKEAQAQNGTSKALLPISILILIGVVADIVITLLPTVMTLIK
jgi:predicted phage tail protein